MQEWIYFCWSTISPHIMRALRVDKFYFNSFLRSNVLGKLFFLSFAFLLAFGRTERKKKKKQNDIFSQEGLSRNKLQQLVPLHSWVEAITNGLLLLQLSQLQRSIRHQKKNLFLCNMLRLNCFNVSMMMQTQFIEDNYMLARTACD